MDMQRIGFQYLLFLLLGYEHLIVQVTESHASEDKMLLSHLYCRMIQNYTCHGYNILEMFLFLNFKIGQYVHLPNIATTHLYSKDTLKPICIGLYKMKYF